ncbi:MAG: hypothetical protein WBM78_27195 [Desulfobacterales bacterium]
MDQISRAEQLEQKRSYWKQQIDCWQETGLTQAEYCRRHNLKHHQLVYWKKRFPHTETELSHVYVYMHYYRSRQILDLALCPGPAELNDC